MQDIVFMSGNNSHMVNGKILYFIICTKCVERAEIKKQTRSIAFSATERVII
jgi:hypothetical protein